MSSIDISELREQIQEMNFTDLFVCDALRAFLAKFKLPADSQEIDKILEEFGQQYSRQNSNHLSSEAVYFLSYSIIMLATDLSSTQIKKKITEEDFLRINKVPKFEDQITPELLTKIYENVAATNLILPRFLENRRVEFESLIEIDVGTILSSWKENWLILTDDGMLHFLERKTDNTPHKSVPLRSPVEIIPAQESLEIKIKPTGQGLFSFSDTTFKMASANNFETLVNLIREQQRAN